MATKKKSRSSNKPRRAYIILVIIVLILGAGLLVIVKTRNKGPLTQAENCKQVIEPIERHKAEAAITIANQKHTDDITGPDRNLDYDIYRAKSKKSTQEWIKSLAETTDTYTTTVEKAGCTPIDVEKFDVGGLPS